MIKKCPIEYTLSEVGRSIFNIFVTLRQWGLDANTEGKAECAFCKKCQPYI